MKLLPNEKQIKPFLYEEEKRPWGYYGLYSHNEPCTSKILYIKPQELLSMQYHFKRDQFYLILDHNFVIEYSKIPVPENIVNNPNEAQRFKDLENFLLENLITVRAYEGDMFGFHRFVVHRALYKGPRSYGRILDIAFGENDELDIVRIKDKYNRIETSE
ncbi:MAG TPA: hypothetical protein P5136_00065 [Methanofastidiosum sp.]|nr:hypothetical protein [Methanofastidiosum sp.]